MLNPPTYLIPIKSDLLRLKKVRHKVLTPNDCNNWTSDAGFHNLWLSHSLDVSISNHIHTICKLKWNVKFRKLVWICIQISNLNKKRKKKSVFHFQSKNILSSVYFDGWKNSQTKENGNFCKNCFFPASMSFPKCQIKLLVSGGFSWNPQLILFIKEWLQVRQTKMS